MVAFRHGSGRARSRGRSWALTIQGPVVIGLLVTGSAPVGSAGPPERRSEEAATHGAPGGQPGGSVADGVFSDAQASRGEQTFQRVCVACHDTNEFSGGRFRLTWVGRTTGDLFDTISTLMPEGDPGSLSPAEYASVVAYLLQLNGYPAGDADLPASLQELGGMEIVEAP